MRQTASIDYINISKCVVCDSEIRNSNKNKIYCSDKCKIQGKRTNDKINFEKFQIAYPKYKDNLEVLDNQIQGLLNIRLMIMEMELVHYEIEKNKELTINLQSVDTTKLPAEIKNDIEQYLKCLGNGAESILQEVQREVLEEINALQKLLKNSLKKLNNTELRK